MCSSPLSLIINYNVIPEKGNCHFQTLLFNTQTAFYPCLKW